jgi:hypothetical protein
MFTRLASIDGAEHAASRRPAGMAASRRERDGLDQFMV